MAVDTGPGCGFRHGVHRHDDSVPGVSDTDLTPATRSRWGPVVQCGAAGFAGAALMAAPFMHLILPLRFTMDADYLEGLVNTGTSGYASNSFNTVRSEEHTSELQSRFDLVCRLLLEKIHINQ